MNERIRELAIKTGWSEDIRYAPRAKEIEKFAELIVREVFSKIEDERFEVYQPVKESVMKHFGVKQ